jgi:hypothetical protein
MSTNRTAFHDNMKEAGVHWKAEADADAAFHVAVAQAWATIEIATRLDDIVALLEAQR